MKCFACSHPIPDDAIYCCYCGRKCPTAKPSPTHRRERNTGTVYKRPNGKYQVTVTVGWYIENGKRKRRTITKTFAKKSDAVNAAATLRDTRPQPTETLRDLREMYIAGKNYTQLSKSQQNKLSYAWTRLRPIELRPIAELTIDDLQQTVDLATATYYPAHDMQVMLSHLYELAIRREIVTTNKSRYLDLPPQPRAKREVWTDEEVDRMWQDYRDGNYFTGYILIMCYCGLRYGELATIRLEDVHLDERYMIGGIKTEAGIDRVIPIAASVYPIVRMLYNTHAEKLLEDGQNSFYARYWETISRLNLRHLPPQTGRHYYFTGLTAAGIQAGIITETGGHASYMTTMRNYVRISLADKLNAVDQIHPAPVLELPSTINNTLTD